MPFAKDTSLFQYLKSRYNLLLEQLNYVAYQNEQLEKQNETLNKELLVLKQQLIEYKENNDAQFGYFKDIINKIETKPMPFNAELLSLKETALKKILIVGFYGAPNSGDELMLQAILNRIDTVKAAVTVMVADNPAYKPLYYRNVSYIHYPKTNMDINIIAQYYDAIVIGGGAHIEDSYFMANDSYKYNVGTIMLELSMAAIANKKEVYCIGLSSAETLSDADYLSKLDHIISNSAIFSVRDKYSLETLRSSGIHNTDRISICSDLAFLLPTDEEDNRKNSDECLVIGLVMVAFSDSDMIKSIITWAEEAIGPRYHDYKFRIIPFYDYLQSDIVNMQRIISEMEIKEKHVEFIPYYQSYNDIVTAFVDCDIIISMRYHASLIAMKSGVPAVSIVYDIHPHYNNKMRELVDLFDENKLFISYKNLSHESLDRALEYAIENRYTISHKTKEKGGELEEKATQDYAEFFRRITV